MFSCFKTIKAKTPDQLVVEAFVDEARLLYIAFVSQVLPNATAEGRSLEALRAKDPKGDQLFAAIEAELQIRKFEIKEDEPLTYASWKAAREQDIMGQQLVVLRKYHHLWSGIKDGKKLGWNHQTDAYYLSEPKAPERRECTDSTLATRSTSAE